MDARYQRILHEFEITDTTGQHFASILYLRELTSNTENDLKDDIDRLLTQCITKGCKVVTEKQPRLIALDNEVDELDARLRDNYQLKAYFSFFAEYGDKGAPTYSRVTVHTTLLVLDFSTAHFFGNVGHQIQVSFDDVNLFALTHTLSPVYLLQEHPLVHGIVCYKDAIRKGVVFFLYRHNDTPSESILAEVDTNMAMVNVLQGIDPSQQSDIEQFVHSLKAQNSLAPLYDCVYIRNYGSFYPTTLILNRERELFGKAKKMIDKELKPQGANNKSFSHVLLCLDRMIEA